MDHVALYEIIYALAAKDGRESALFGSGVTEAREAFERSLAGDAFPELWFELPLSGEPWMDFHALISYEDVAGTQAAYSGQAGAYADALRWFAAQKPHSVRQLALSYDTSTGDVESPAVQLLVNGEGTDIPLGFLRAAGRADAQDGFRTFIDRKPRDWYACYVGVFPGRNAATADQWVRVECIVEDELQRAYADDRVALLDHLTRVGFQDVDEAAIEAIQLLARSPFPLELQFNIGVDGAALPIVSASVRFNPDHWFDEHSRGDIVLLARALQSRGHIDGRWQQLAGTVYAKRVTHGNSSALISCFPAFVKLRWRAGGEIDAKTYLLARVEEPQSIS